MNISNSDGYDQDATRRIDMTDERFGSRPRDAGDPTGVGVEGDAVGEQPAHDAGEGERPPHRGRDIGFAVLGAVMGILLTFIVVALTTGGASDDLGDNGAPAAEREAELAEREAELAERDRQIDELDARVMDLEAQLAAVSDDDADRDTELAAQREALDERLAAFDARVEEADDRQASLEQRAAALDEREAAITDAQADAGSDPDDDNGDGGVDLDELADTAEGIIDRVLEEIRNLFGQN